MGLRGSPTQPWGSVKTAWRDDHPPAPQAQTRRACQLSSHRTAPSHRSRRRGPRGPRRASVRWPRNRRIVPGIDLVVAKTGVDGVTQGLGQELLTRTRSASAMSWQPIPDGRTIRPLNWPWSGHNPAWTRTIWTGESGAGAAEEYPSSASIALAFLERDEVAEHPSNRSSLLDESRVPTDH